MYTPRAIFCLLKWTVNSEPFAERVMEVVWGGLGMPQQSTIIYRNPLFSVQEMTVFGSRCKFASFAVGDGVRGVSVPPYRSYWGGFGGRSGDALEKTGA